MTAPEQMAWAATTAIQPIALDAKQVIALLGISQSLFYAMKQDGRFAPEPRRLGRAVRYDRKEVVAWWDAGAPSRSRWEATQRGARR